MTSAASSAVPTDPVETALRLAVLLDAGLTPAVAWGAIAQRGDATTAAAARAAERGEGVGEVLRREGAGWSDVAAVYTVAVDAGAPLADTLRVVVGALRDAAEVAADVRVALAEPAATANLLAWLPVLGIPLGIVLGFDTIGILCGDPVGIACLVAGISLVLVSRVWSRRLVRRSTPPAVVPGLDAELWAVALSAGVSVDRAGALVAAARGDDSAVVAVSDPVGATLDLATRTGVPATELLRGDAWLARHRARTDGRAAAARLSTRLLVPLGVCTLPAFLLLAVAPMMLGVLRSSALP